eukprot:2601494-Amphidinium_carterae.1
MHYMPLSITAEFRVPNLKAILSMTVCIRRVALQKHLLGTKLVKNETNHLQHEVPEARSMPFVGRASLEGCSLNL